MEAAGIDRAAMSQILGNRTATGMIRAATQTLVHQGQ